MSYTLIVAAIDSLGRPLYETTVGIDGVTEEKAPGAAIEFAIERLKEAGYPRIQHQVARWTVQQLWIGETASRSRLGEDS